MGNQNWKIKFNWIKAHAGHHGNELADQTAREASINSDINECYTRIPKSAVRRELRDYSATEWQSEWDITTKGVFTKLFFSNVTDRLKLKINVTPHFTTMETGLGNIKSYLLKYKIKDRPTCSCKRAEQTIDHIIFNCELVEKERDRLKAAVLRSENWPVSKDTLINKYSKGFKKSRTVYHSINYREIAHKITNLYLEK